MPDALASMQAAGDVHPRLTPPLTENHAMKDGNLQFSSITAKKLRKWQQ